MVAFIGLWEFLILAAILAFLFGGKRIVSAGRSLGKGAREFKTEIEDEEKPRTESRPLPPASPEDKS
jgi:TatA/E family protein of Tat protein translocase